jgi:hypothetical protein
MPALSQTSFSDPYGSEKGMHVISPQPLPSSTAQIPFNKVMVHDLRRDTTFVGYAEDGIKLVLSESVARSFKKCLQYMVADNAIAGNTLLLDIRQFYADPDSIYFSGSFYQMMGDSTLLPLVYIDHLTQSINEGHIRIREGLGMLMDNLIKRSSLAMYAGSSPFKDRIGGQTGHASAYGTSGNGHYPVQDMDTLLRGVYFDNYLQFRDLKPRYASFTMRHNGDSTWYPETFDKSRKSRLRKAWALNDSKGNLYLHVWKQYWLPLKKFQDTFYVRVPLSLPSMKYIIKLRLINRQDFRLNPLQMDFYNSETAGIIILSVMTGGLALVPYAYVSSERHKESKELLKKGYACKDYRDFGLDLETMGVVYNRP